MDASHLFIPHGSFGFFVTFFAGWDKTCAISTDTPTTNAPAPTPTARLGSIDAYRGFVMFLMMGEVLNFCRVAEKLESPGFWAILCQHQSHVDWTGCVLHDLIQPSFSFLVGVALPFSVASRRARGQGWGALAGHAFFRAIGLTLLGVWLRSTHSTQTRWTFEDTLSQIGMGYLFLFGFGFQSRRFQWAAFWTILVGYWALFALWPLPGPDFDYSRVDVSAQWLQQHGLSGFTAHWQKNSNPAWAFDTWFLNLFPRVKPFIDNDGGYSTISFIPTLGTMVLGLLAGGVLRSPSKPIEKVRWLLVAGALSLAIGWLLGALGVCPVVKRIWTPSWVLFSGGWCLLFLAGFYAVIDAFDLKNWAFPLKVVGMNSIAAYLIAHLFEGFIARDVKIHLGSGLITFWGNAYEPFVHGLTILAVYWLLLLWLYRRKIFLRL